MYNNVSWYVLRNFTVNLFRVISSTFLPIPLPRYLLYICRWISCKYPTSLNYTCVRIYNSDVLQFKVRTILSVYSHYLSMEPLHDFTHPGSFTQYWNNWWHFIFVWSYILITPIRLTKLQNFWMNWKKKFLRTDGLSRESKRKNGVPQAETRV